MTEAGLHSLATWMEILFAAAALLALVFVTAPYGRHRRSGWGPTIPNSLGWILMESPAVLGFAAIYAAGRFRADIVPLVFGGMWMIHYVHRTFVFPFRVRTTGKRMPLVIAGMALVFNCLNAYVIARWISHLSEYETAWLRDPRFIAGVVVFAFGLIINLWADSVLISLRRPGETGYVIPGGGLYDYVACPNYLGEIIEWIGYAIALWALPGVAFALFTIANVGPRAQANLEWYRETFPDYPPQRKALVPFLV